MKGMGQVQNILKGSKPYENIFEMMSQTGRGGQPNFISLIQKS